MIRKFELIKYAMFFLFFLELLNFLLNAYLYKTPGYFQLYLSELKMICVFVFYVIFFSGVKCYRSELLIECCIIIVWSYTFLVILYHKDISGVAGENVISAVDFHKSFLINYLFYYAFGRVLFVDQCKINKNVLCIFYGIVSLVVIFSFDLNDFILKSIMDETGFDGSYLQIGDFFSIIALLLVPNVSSSLNKMLMIFMSIILLYFIGSRGSLYSYLFAVSVYLYIYRDQTLNFRTIFSLICFSIIVLFIYISYANVSDNFDSSNSRMFAIFNGLDSDYSVNARSDLLYQGISDIYDNPFFGEFAGQLKHYGDDQGTRWGGYIHSILSYWRQFGIIPFLLLIVTYIHGGICLLNNRHNLLAIMFQQKVLLSLFCFVELFFVRSYYSSYLMLSFGLLNTKNES